MQVPANCPVAHHQGNALAGPIVAAMIAKPFILAKDNSRIGAKILRDHPAVTGTSAERHDWRGVRGRRD
jgi:hypothetical protein